MADDPTFDEIRAALGQLVRQTREGAGMDIETVARRSELNPDEIRAIEQGVNPEPNYSDFILLAGALGVAPARFFSIARWEPSRKPDIAGGFAWRKRVSSKD